MGLNASRKGHRLPSSATTRIDAREALTALVVPRPRLPNPQWLRDPPAKCRKIPVLLLRTFWPLSRVLATLVWPKARKREFGLFWQAGNWNRPPGTSRKPAARSNTGADMGNPISPSSMQAKFNQRWKKSTSKCAPWGSAFKSPRISAERFALRIGLEKKQSLLSASLWIVVLRDWQASHAHISSRFGTGNGSG